MLLSFFFTFFINLVSWNGKIGMYVSTYEGIDYHSPECINQLNK